MDMVGKYYFSTKKISLNGRVAERINLPANPWNLTKLLLDILVPECSLIDHVDIVYSGLVVHAHAPISSTQEAMYHSPQNRNSYANTSYKVTAWELEGTYINSSRPALMSPFTVSFIMSFWFLHHLWKNACSRTQTTGQEKHTTQLRRTHIAQLQLHSKHLGAELLVKLKFSEPTARIGYYTSFTSRNSCHNNSMIKA